MKKIIALVLCVVVVCALSVSAFADAKVPSKEGEKQIEITIRACESEGQKADVPFTVKIDDAKVTVKAEKSRGTFNGWALYKKVDGKYVPAEVNSDYIVLKGDMKSNELQIEAKTDLIICANYNGKTTDPSVSGPALPKAGDNSVVFIAFAMLAAAAVVFGAKKVTSK